MTDIQTPLPPAPPPQKPTKMHYLTIAICILNIAVCGFNIMEMITSRFELETISEQNKVLDHKSKSVDEELVKLRTTIMSSHHENVIFLKIIYLKPEVNRELARDIAVKVYRYSKEYRMDSDLILAMISVESGFDPKAESKVGAKGLMQIMDHWAKIWNIKGSLFDPDVSIRYGIQILKAYQDLYPDLELALAVYNRGPGMVDWDIIKKKDPVTANNYAENIMKRYNDLKNLRVK